MKMNENTEKLTEKAFLRLIVTSIIGIVLCLGCLCSTTWAWFADGIKENSSTLIPAQNELSIEIVKDTGDGSTENVNVEELTSENGVALAGGTYVVTLSRPAGSSSGYFVLKYKDVSYYSEGVIRISDNDVDTSATYVFVVPEGNDARVRLEVRWGLYSGDTVIKRKPADATGYVPFDLTAVASAQQSEG